MADPSSISLDEDMMPYYVIILSSWFFAASMTNLQNVAKFGKNWDFKWQFSAMPDHRTSCRMKPVKLLKFTSKVVLKCQPNLV